MQATSHLENMLNAIFQLLHLYNLALCQTKITLANIINKSQVKFWTIIIGARKNFYRNEDQDFIYL